MTNLGDGGFLRDSTTHALVVTGYGTELGYAENTSDVTGISTVADVTGLSITFTVGQRPVMVEAVFPLVGQVTSTGQPTLFITNSSNTALASANPPSMAAAGLMGGLIAKMRLAANSGAQTVKVRATTTAGTVTIFSNSNRKTYIQAYEVQVACSSRSKGTYVASEVAIVEWGRTGKAGQMAVISAQGSHSVGDNYLGDPTAAALGDAGFVSVQGDLSQTTSQGTYGNDTAVTRIGQLKTFIQGASSPLQAASGKVHLLGASGGAADAINYARANPTLVASLYLVVPLTDILALYNNPTRVAAAGITQAEMNKAYNAGVDDGGTAFLAAMATHDPSATGNQAALANVPMKLVYSDSDPVIPPATVTAYAALVNAAGGRARTASEGAVGHSAAGIVPADVVAFFNDPWTH